MREIGCYATFYKAWVNTRMDNTENQTRVIMTLKRESSTCLQNDYILNDSSTRVNPFPFYI